MAGGRRRRRGRGQRRLGGRALRAGEEHGSTDTGPRLLFTAVLAFAVLGLSGLVHVDGILAVFVCGPAFNVVSTGADRTDDSPIDEAVNRFLVLPLFVNWVRSCPGRPGANSAGGACSWPSPCCSCGGCRSWCCSAGHRGCRGRTRSSSAGSDRSACRPSSTWRWEAERLDVDPVVLAAGSLVVAASTVAHGITSSPGRALFRKVTAPPKGADVAARRK